ncbi:MAG: mannose-1-phosphate guanylyltransferase, partial [Gammaproteobacteria bacterium]|nr:mannose-1-phosphate guanylyltransferase [Gammaproteobacteria bacterium]
MQSSNLYAVILAGGSGTRFWPVSRKAKPKQFLNITGNGTLLQETLERIKPEIPGAHIFIITNAAYRSTVGRQTASFKIPKANILLEPEGKNTAPAICWAAAKIQEINPDAVMVVLPSDHLILKQKKFLKVVREAVRLAQKNYLVTLGITPTRPDTGYGYLKTEKKKINGKQIVKVEKFTEKPSLSKAKQFLKTKKYFWNSGM